MEHIQLKVKQHARRKYFLLLAIVLLMVFITALTYWYRVLRNDLSTDDAYVAGNTNPVSSQVSGSVTVVNHTDTNYVQQGDILVMLDKTDATIAYNKARSNLASVVRETRKLYLLDSEYQANIAAARVQYQQATEDYQRRLRLARNGVIARETLEHASDTTASSKAALDAAIQAYNANKALLMNTPLDRQPQVLQAADQTKEAWLALQRTEIRSPVTGYVAQRSVQVGQTINPAQPLLAVVPVRQMWVNANFKETQLTGVRIGQPVKITSDLYGDKVVFHGRVKGIRMGTGNAFSLLPAENATGNWIKVVQRVPVEVSLDAQELQQHPLRIGLSMTATIDTRRENVSVMPALSSTVITTPAYTSHALVIDTTPVDQEISAIISRNGQA